ncbi:MAG TPA: permease, partial [Gemmataceae bacterium]|nr:permease [Gemmataceae bacterium]
NVVVAISTFTAFGGFGATAGAPGGAGQLGGWGMLAARMFFGYLVAVGTALIVEWQFQRHGYKLVAPGLMPEKVLPSEDDNGSPRPRRTAWQAVGAITETALHDFVDITFFLIIGALLAAAVRILLPHQTMTDMANQHWVVSILAMMGLAILLCLCSEADAFVAASFGPVRASAKVGFLVLGPMLDFKLFFMYLRVFRPRLIATIMASVVVQVFFYAVLFHLWWEGSLSTFFRRGS